MRYTGAKFKLCRREGINLFGPDKYDVKNRRGAPGQHGAANKRQTEYSKILRNKQVLKRMYGMSEKQFSNLVNVTSKKYAKNKGQEHDAVLTQFLNRRLDNVILRAGFARTIMQARQMVVHGHFLLNGHKHNVPSYFVNPTDIITLKKGLQASALYDLDTKNFQPPVRLSTNFSNFEVKILELPGSSETEGLPVDVLKIIEYYARA
ncbi:MAG: 30S ribosomal protein S4 [Candidatus Absconditabacterales bacterium]